MASPWPGTPYLPVIPNGTCLANTSGSAAPPIPLPYTTTGIPGATGATGPAGPIGLSGPTGPTGPQGVAGPQGPSGAAGYLASSPTAMIIGTGTQSFTTQPSLAYAPGARIRLASRSAPTNFMEGICTAYNSTTGAMTANFDTTGGSGSFADWDINLAGQRGATGATGPVGPFGSPIVVSDTAPATPSQGTLWWDSVGAQLYLWYVDANSSQWVIANSLPVGPPGPVGATGGVGPAGPAGPVGATGAAGPTGPLGSVGPAGPIGATGPPGNPQVLFVGDSPPGGATPGQTWWDSADGQLYIYYNDGSSTQWVPAAASAGAGSFVPIAGGTMTGALAVQNQGVLVGNAGTQAGQGTLVLNANAAAGPARTTALRILGSDGVGTTLELEAFGSGANPTLNTLAYGGTGATPGATPGTSNLGTWNFAGYDGTAVGVGATILSQAGNLWSGTNHNGNIVMQGTAPNTTTLTTMFIGRPDIGAQLLGTQTNDNAAAGWVGEFLSASAAESAVNIPNATYTQLASLALTPGDWDIWGAVGFILGSGGATAYIGSIYTTVGGGGVNANSGWPTNNLAVTMQAGSGIRVPLQPARVSIAATTTIYLIGYLAFPSGTCTAGGFIGARRRR